MPTPPAKRPAPTFIREEFVRVAGLPAVQALFARRPNDIERLFYHERLKTQVGEWCKALAGRRKPYRMVDDAELAKVAGTLHHGGIVAIARPHAVESFDPAKAAAWAKAGKPLILLDGIGNPHNLGAIARSMAFFGLDHLLISDHPDQAAPSEAAHRVAEGGLDWVTVYRAPGFPQVMATLTAAGYRVVGTALDGASSLADLPRDKPLALVLGNEENGLPVATLDACNLVVKLPGSGRVQSLNVSATAAILAWELAR